MVKYIILLEQQEAIDLISRIDTCMGFPSDGTTTWQLYPDEMCEFDLETGQKQFMGYGVMIKDRIMDCLSEVEKTEILILPSNINTCQWVVSGATN
jgi:hypothetical protein